MTVFFPRRGLAQCTCAGGVPATVVTQTQTVGPTINSTTGVTFNKYLDPSGMMGISCFNFDDTIWAASTSFVTNNDADSTVYSFNTTINYNVKGPAGGGINLSNSKNLAYGPDTLGGLFQPGQNITLGPDSTFSGAATQTHNNGATGAYSGVGTIPITITFGGGSIASGGSNYSYTIQTNYVGVFKLTYFICPTVALSNTITDFTAAPNGQAITLQWLANNQQINTNYEIQTSTDGKSFSDIGQTTTDPAAAGTTSKYQYQYHPDQTNVGKRWFRIKETDATGKVTYSTVLILHAGDDAAAGPLVSYGVYPNPATNSLVFQFNDNQTGRYVLELVNTAGQTVQRMPVTLTGTSQIRMNLSPQPVKGLYFLRTTDVTHNQEYVSKVFIQ
jgi:Secretion system C-terminal sorting domain